MKERTSLDRNELMALAYFAVGVSSEGSYAGKDRAYKLSFAGKYSSDGRMLPSERSGISYGTLQKDLGQAGIEHVSGMLDAHQAWARANSPSDLIADDDIAQVKADLARNGDEIRAQNGRPVDAIAKAKLQRFLESDTGRDFVRRSDRAEAEGLVNGPLKRLESTPAFEQASSDDKVRLAVLVAKSYNQNRVLTNRMLDRMEDGGRYPRTLTSLDEVISHTENFSSAMRSGRDAALSAAELYMKLRDSNPDSPMYAAWDSVLRDPLGAESTGSASDVSRDFTLHQVTIRNLFLDVGNSMRLVDAIDQGVSHGSGRPSREGGRNPTSGFYFDGTDLVQWNADGRGVAYLNGQWSEITRDDISRQRNGDGSIDLFVERDGLTQPLLHVNSAISRPRQVGERTLREGMNGDDVRALQQSLAQLNYTDSRGRPLRPDGDFGPTTTAALEAFQRDHQLSADGIAGPATLASMRDAAGVGSQSIGRPDAAYPGLHQQRESMAPYQALRPEPIPALGTAPMIQARPDAPDSGTHATETPAASLPDAERISRLQHQLNALGMTDARNETLDAHGVYDLSTRAAVARFQSQEGFEVTGFADENTQRAIEGRALIASLQQEQGLHHSWSMPAHDVVQARTIEAPTERDQVSSVVHSNQRELLDGRVASSVIDRPLHAQGGPDLDDPRHPESAHHGLYSELGRRVPYASEERLLQFTAACHTNRITGDNLSVCHLDEANMRMGFLGKGPLTTPVTVDLSRPPPEPEQAVAQIAQYDQHQALVRSEYLAQQQQQQMSRGGPSL